MWQPALNNTGKTRRPSAHMSIVKYIIHSLYHEIIIFVDNRVIGFDKSDILHSLRVMVVILITNQYRH